MGIATQLASSCRNEPVPLYQTAIFHLRERKVMYLFQARHPLLVNVSFL